MSALERPMLDLPAGPSPIAESIGDLLETTLVAAKPWPTPGTDQAPGSPKGRIELDRADRANLVQARERVLHGDLAAPVAEPVLAGFAVALAQILLDQEPIA